MLALSVLSFQYSFVEKKNKGYTILHKVAIASFLARTRNLIHWQYVAFFLSLAFVLALRQVPWSRSRDDAVGGTVLLFCGCPFLKDRRT